eukprot:gnl/MRDRNA2_/MRDRNA2_18507_c0_seq1.p1 gnl/MRDRNA2_/MRDRNA2_18507_c0~~gnl/MRDRNA2_/MRDRNA2_18507_c0_seq1.p1  ORF type:complete len:589 (+),score=113.37 gnl/MRDRNA2_/MRDRNA2_18507_c0_seq1:94-1860(+)
MSLHQWWVLILAELCHFTAAGTSPAVVALSDGSKLHGISSGLHSMFLGVRYAKAPTADLRWRAPQPTGPLGEYEATEYGASCMQSDPGDFNPPLGEVSEDCLFLNVYTPRMGPNSTDTKSVVESKSLVPVLVWIHGGSFSSGGSAESRLNGTFDIDMLHGNSKELVIVTLNYRLGAFGFLGSDALRSRTDDGSTGNYGILDQRAALQWVQVNIESFGGDRNRVLVMGQSAGAGSVTTHVVAKNSHGLFKRAAMFSGAFSTWISVTMKDAEANYQSVLDGLNCKTIECLLKATTDDILSAQPDWWGPVVDGVELPEPPWTMLQNNAADPNVDAVIMSSTRDDATLSIDENMDSADFQDFLNGLDIVQNANTTAAGKQIQAELSQLYPSEPQHPAGESTGPSFYSGYYWAAKRLTADAEMYCPARRAARIFARSSNGVGKAYLAYFAEVPAGQDSACHACDIPFYFHVTSVPSGQEDVELQSERNVQLSDLILQHLEAFAWSAKPFQQVEESVWPAYEQSTDAVYQWGGQGPKGQSGGLSKVLHGFRKAQCNFWDQYIWESPIDTKKQQKQQNHQMLQKHQKRKQQLIWV